MKFTFLLKNVNVTIGDNRVSIEELQVQSECTPEENIQSSAAILQVLQVLETLK